MYDLEQIEQQELGGEGVYDFDEGFEGRMKGRGEGEGVRNGCGSKDSGRNSSKNERKEEREREVYQIQLVIKSFISVRDKVFEILGIRDKVKRRYEVVNNVIKEVVDRSGEKRIFLDLGNKANMVYISDEAKNLLIEYRKRQKRAVESLLKYLRDSGTLRWLCSVYGLNFFDMEEVVYDTIYKILDAIKDTSSVMVYVVMWLKTEGIRKKKFDDRFLRIGDFLGDGDYVCNEDVEFRMLYQNLSDLERERFLVGDMESYLISCIEEREREMMQRNRIKDKMNEIFQKKTKK